MRLTRNIGQYYSTLQSMSPKSTNKTMSGVHHVKKGESSDSNQKKENAGTAEQEDHPKHDDAFRQERSADDPNGGNNEGMPGFPSPLPSLLLSNASASAQDADHGNQGDDIFSDGEEGDGNDLVRKLLKEVGKPIVLPSDVGIAEHSDTDVLTGRGGRTNNLPGNRYFRSMIRKYSNAYEALEAKSKPSITRRILELVRGRGGRFLRFNKNSNHFYEIGDVSAREKISQSLRSMTFQQRREAKVVEARSRRDRKQANAISAHSSTTLASVATIASSAASTTATANTNSGDTPTATFQQESSGEGVDIKQPPPSRRMSTSYQYLMDRGFFPTPSSLEDYQPFSLSGSNFNPTATTPALTSTAIANNDNNNNNTDSSLFQMRGESLSSSNNYGGQQQDRFNAAHSSAFAQQSSSPSSQLGPVAYDDDMRDADKLTQQAAYLRTLAASYESMAEKLIHGRDHIRRREPNASQQDSAYNSSAALFNNNAQSPQAHQYHHTGRQQQQDFHATNSNASTATHFTSNSGQSSVATPRPAFQTASATPTAAASMPFAGTDTTLAYFPDSNAANFTRQSQQYTNPQPNHYHTQLPAMSPAAMRQHLENTQYTSQNRQSSRSAFQASSSSYLDRDRAIDAIVARDGPRMNASFSIPGVGLNEVQLQQHDTEPIPHNGASSHSSEDASEIMDYVSL